MYLCYVDESGVQEIHSGTSHFVLIGFVIEAPDWKIQDQAVEAIKTRYGLNGAEIHTAWIAGRMVEQEKIKEFETLNWEERRKRVAVEREARLIKTAATKGTKEAGDLRKNFRKTERYTHLTLKERHAFLGELAALVGSWNTVVLFGDAIDKRGITLPAARSPREEAFTQIISRLQFFLKTKGPREIGIIVHDDNKTDAMRLTEMMRDFHEKGTAWTSIPNIIETPFFVNSELNRGVQLADLCAYGTRRFFENGETFLFDRFYKRFRRVEKGLLVGLRHFVGRGTACKCKVCADHHRTASATKKAAAKTAGLAGPLAQQPSLPKSP